MRGIRRVLWIGAAIFGVAFLALGSFFVAKGLDAKAQVRAGLVEEQIKTSADGVQFGAAEGTLVTDAKTALVQADTIKFHTMGKWGPYSQMARTDPNRATYLDGVALRTALNLAVMGFGVADMAVGTGVMVILLGIATLAVGVPALAWAAQAEGLVVKEVRREVVRPTLATEPRHI